MNSHLKNRFFIIGFLLSTSTLLLAQKPKLKSVDYKNYEAESSQSLSLNKRVHTEYDKSGNVLKEETFIKNFRNEIIKQSLLVNKSDEKGKYQIATSYDSLENVKKEVISISNFRGQKLRVIERSAGEEGFRQTTEIYTYNSKGKISKTQKYNYLSVLIAETKHKYNHHNEETKVVSWEFLDEQGTSIAKTSKEVFYDDNGFMTKNITLRSEKTAEGKKELKDLLLFEKNQVVEITKWQNNQIVSQWKRGESQDTPKKPGETLVDFGNWATNTEYDDLGRKIATTFTEIDYKTGEEFVTQTNLFEYDDNDNITKTIKIIPQADGTELTEVDAVEYDDYENVIRKAHFVNNELIEENLYSYEFHSDY